MKKMNRPNRVLGAAAILLCLCLISAHFTMGLYARYTTRASAKDSARVAEFNVEAEVTEVPDSTAGTDDQLTRTYKATLTNNSEVAVCASIKMVFNDKGVIVKSGNAGGSDINGEENTIVFNGTYDLAPGQTLDNITLTITLDAASVFAAKSVDNKIDTFSNEDLSSATYQLPYNAIVTFVQID